MFNTAASCAGAPAGGADPIEPGVSLSPMERARQREIASYLTAASITPNTQRLNVESPSPAVSSLDPSLTALVQLGALRLDCDRSFLSLIDGRTQYIVAEATRSTCLTPDNGGTESNGLYLGVTLMDVSFGVCPNTMRVFTDETEESAKIASESPNITADMTRYIIHDFQADAHYRQRPYVTGFPYMRSYAEVPIISPLGYVIGGYCVVDDKLRNFGDDTIRVLTEISSTIMAHLEHVRIRNNHDRSERLIRGLDSFIQENSVDRESRNEILSTGRSSRNSSQTRSVDNSASNGGRAAQLTMEPSRWVFEAASSNGDGATASSSANQLDQMQSSEDGNDAMSTQTSEFTRPSELAPSVLESTESIEVRKAFERSASLIRDSMNMDGLVFLDACPIGFVSRQPYSLALGMENPFKSSIDDLSEISSATESCPVLAASIHKTKTVSPFSIPEGLLYRLIRRYKQGHVFSADEFGSFEKRTTAPQESAKTRPPLPSMPVRRMSKDQNDANELFQYIPQACSILFLPLWHFQKEKWFAAAIGWTSDPTKSFDPSDRTYLSAFGNSIMAEIHRLETIAVSKAKSDFISSISHELRSPLHGILATTELLQATLNTAEEQSLLNMVKTCGNTLLDTMNHLLDYAKINSLALTRNGKATIPKNTSQADMAKFTSQVDLDILVEEVIESVVVGFRTDKDVLTQTSKDSILSPLVRSAIEEPPLDLDVPVLVTINIQHAKDWALPLESGGWKRIVMNLFGNALKYTHSGQITVQLDVNSQASGDYIRFRVKDTGIGMGEEYQKYKLFTPFAQEDSLVKGTGLGLCIVQQIVWGMGGTIEVQSERGRGTEVTVQVPLPKSNQLPALEERPSQSRSSLLQGLTLGFIESPGQNEDPEEEMYGTKLSIVSYNQALKASLATMARDWLGMTVVSGSENGLQADIYVLNHSLEAEQPYPALPSTSGPLVVIRAPHSSAVPQATFGSTLRLPVGPRRLAAALTDALKHPRQQRGEATAKVGTVFLPTIEPAGVTPATLPTPPDEEATAEILPSIPSTLLNSAKVAPSLNVSTPTALGSQHHVLVVDDNAINLKILVTLLKRLGCTYQSAFNGLEALQLYRASTPTQRFSHVFMDISMPVMDGYTATREIRACELETGMPAALIVALTGLGSPASEKKAFDSGMDMFLTKPVSLVKLKALLVENEDP